MTKAAADQPLQCFLVGGAVRDRLLGRPVQDRDYVVVGADPQTMQERGFKPVGADFPVFLHPQSGEAYALARTERKSGTGHKGFVFHTATDVTLEDDLQRRDLTINAMAEDEGGRLIDPFGGAQDLHRRVLRHVSEAFVEDPLRVLRVARFAACYDFSIAPETLTLMRRLARAGELETLTPERVWLETDKALRGIQPVRYIQALRDCEALEVLFPELDRLFGVPQTARYHPEIDTGIHTLMALEQATRLSPEPEVRFATLTHDLGKGVTPPGQWPSHKKHDILGVPVIETLCKRLKAPTQYRQLAVLVCRHHIQCHRILEMRPGTVVKFLEQLDALRRPQRFAQFLLCCTADVRGRKGMQDVPCPQIDYLRKALGHCQEVEAAPLVAQGLTGQALARALRRKRARRLQIQEQQ